MKNLIFAIILILGMNVYAQTSSETSDAFVRVYDQSGKKIAKGKIYSVSETFLQLKRKRGPIEIPVRRIGSIKTKRSAGNNLLVGAAVGASTMAVIGAASADPDDFLGFTAGEGAAAGALLGGAAGTVIGGISILFKRSETYTINGDQEKWNAFIERMK